MRRFLLVLVLGVVAPLAACAPPRAVQFVGQDGSRDWWAVDCRSDEAACWRQANEACHDSFTVREVREGGEAKAASRSMTVTVKDGVPPSGVAIGGKVLVVTCAEATLPPRSVAGPECSISPPRPNHCDDAAGLTFTTGRTYLTPSSPSNAKVSVAVTRDVMSPEDALAELRTIGDGFDDEVQAIRAPIAAIDAVAKSLHDFPSTYRVKPAQVKAWARASIGGKVVALPDELRPEVTDDLAALLARVQAADAAVRATPERAAALLAKVSERHARVRVLAAAASAPSAAAVASASATAAERTAADARLAEIQALQVAARKKLDAVRTTVTDLSAQIMQALAKLGDAAS